MERHAITLQFPVEVGGQKVAELNFRRPKVRDLRKLRNGKGSDEDRSLALMADLAEVDPAVIDELDPVDLAQINRWLEPILDPPAEAAS